MWQMAFECDKCCLKQNCLFRNLKWEIYYLLKRQSLENMSYFLCFGIDAYGSKSLESISLGKSRFTKQNLRFPLNEISSKWTEQIWKLDSFAKGGLSDCFCDYNVYFYFSSQIW